MNMKKILGVDIGGTKFAISVANVSNDSIDILSRISFDSIGNPKDIEFSLFPKIDELLENLSLSSSDFSAIGISCGGIIDSENGIVITTPVLPQWLNVNLREILSKRYNLPVYVLNDANACAVAEWKYGAGRGSNNMAFLTCGTGIGAGLILNGRLYEGVGGAAGEFGHMRAEGFGPVGCGKAGSYEGFCSGSGIASLAKTRALELLQAGKKCSFCDSLSSINQISAKSVADSANAGDEVAIQIYETAGDFLGRGIAILIDLLNIEVVSIGSVFVRAENLLRPAMERAIAREAMAYPRSQCKILPAGLGEKVGDYASACVAIDGLSKESK
jgi:glucokinase